MGLLVDGKWQDVWYDTKSSDGKFVRQPSKFTNWVGGDSEFAAESGRYHLYVSLACPWAHRTLILRKLKGLEQHISVSVVHPDMMEQGWKFEDYPAATEDHLFAARHLHEIYTRAQSDITTRVTVPVLWDKKTQQIVNNESEQIVRIFNTAFNQLTGNTDDYYPESLQSQINDINTFVYDSINNGVYKAGFATTQEAYEEAVYALFAGLDKVEQILSEQRYLVGKEITEADWRLFTTLIRFDAVYVGHFKCNLRRIEDYPNLSNYLRDLYQHPGVAQTVNMDHIKRHYYYSHGMINPTRVVPAGPEQDFNREHDRDRF
ncbi:MAG: glutathione S-transferase family protein [Alteromonadaceae bacterium]|nr:glutathione S-transferase family protein [Alteromonadaceae bacterium]